MIEFTVLANQAMKSGNNPEKIKICSRLSSDFRLYFYDGKTPDNKQRRK
jgi:hypothetical protein